MSVLWLGADPFLHLTTAYRSVWFRGAFGSGKTLMAFATAQWLCDHQGMRHMVSNIPCVWCDVTREVVLAEHAIETGETAWTADTVFVLDEAGLFLRFADAAHEYLQYLRKLNVVLLLPSFSSVSMKLRGFIVERYQSLAWLGVPLWVWRYRLESDEWQYFAVSQWQSVYGVYSTLAMPSDDAGLSVWLREVTNEVRSKIRAAEVGHSARRSAEGVLVWVNDTVTAGGSGAGSLSPLEGRALESQFEELSEISERIRDDVSLQGAGRRRNKR